MICGGPCGLANPDYSFWLVGSRTQWSPWAGQLNIGVDVVYASYQTAITTFTPGTPVPTGGAQAAKLIGDTDEFLVMFRVQRNWYP